MGIVLLTKIVLIISTHPHGAHTLWLQSFLVFLCLQELNQSLCILCRSHNFYTAISRKVVGKKCARDNPECNMGYDQYTVPGDCSCQAYFCCFPLALANMSMASRAILSNFFEEQLTQNHPKYLSELSRALFPTTFLKISVFKTYCNKSLTDDYLK